MTTPAYRRDIDGLRAVAIIPVVLYHAGVLPVSGGYVGVDIFFVISGFLITGVIAREVDAGAFSLIHFYERRARRILPALMLMMTTVLAAAAILYLPADFSKVPRAALSTTLFLSNAYFFHETGYFAGGADTMPLLHTWSLAVEEQFYFGFPLVLMLVARCRPQWRIAIVAIFALISFALAVKTQADGTGFAFYLLPPRAWELFAGALLALGAVPAVRWLPLRNLISLAGVAAIGWAIFSFTPKTTFPGVNALYPVLGAAMLINCAPASWLGRLLASRVMVGIGLISYSLYLWHWPLIVFTEYATDAPLSGWRSLSVIGAAVLLATLSWRFVERPFRRAQAFSRRRLFGLAGTAMLLVSLMSGALIVSNGWRARFAPEVLMLADARNDISPARSACISNEIGGPRPRCTLGAPVPPSALIWGDSHGVELAWVLGEIAQREGHSIIQRTRASCPPIADFSVVTDAGCAAFNDDVFGLLRRNPDIRTVYLSGFWASKLYASAATARALDDTIMRLLALDRHVIFIGAVPPQPADVPRYLAHQAQRDRLAAARGVGRATVDARALWLTPAYPRWRAAGVTIIDPADRLCNAQNCALVMNGAPLYFDAHHLSLAGARVVLSKSGSAR